MFKSTIKISVSIIISFLVFSYSANAQGSSQLISRNLTGEPVINGISFDDVLNAKYFEYYATETKIYDRNGTAIYSPPFPGKITHFAQKLYYGVTEENYAYIVLDNLNIYLVDLKTNSANIMKQGYLSPAGNSNIDQVQGADNIYLLTSNGFYINRDTLKTWLIDSTGLNGAIITRFAIDSLKRVYAATGNGIFIQQANSNTWQHLLSFNFTDSLSSVFIDRFQDLFVGGTNGSLYKSTDFGTTWVTDAAWNYGVANKYTRNAFGDLFIITVDNKLYKQPTISSAWTEIDAGITYITDNSVTYNRISGDTVLFAYTNFGLFVSFDRGTSWTLRNRGLQTDKVFGYIQTADHKDVISNVQGAFISSDDSIWTKIFPLIGLTSGIRLDKDALGYLYSVIPPVSGSVHFSAVYKSTDDGAVWFVDTAGLSSTFGTLFYIDEYGTQYSVGSLSGVPGYVFKKPLNAGWQLDTAGLFANSISFGSSIVSDRKGYLYLSGSYNGRNYLRRPINGNTWGPDISGIPPGNLNNYFTKMTVHKDGTIFATDGINLMERVNNSWTTLPFPGNGISAFAVDTSGTIYLALTSTSNSFIYSSSDKGQTWSHVSGFDNVPVNSLRSFGGITYVLTDGLGIWAIERTTGVNDQVNVAASFQLYQNYPNPFNPSTTIKYSINEKGYVKLAVYDLMGREISSLVNEVKTPGQYSVRFNGDKFSSGVYFYRLTVNNNSLVKKLLFLK
jgi:Secretion system C-terminal sorting domain